MSRSFIAENDDVSTVVCAPVYGEILGLATEVVIGMDEGVPRSSAVRCDFLMLMAKAKLTHFVGSLSAQKLEELDGCLRIALGMR